MRKSFVCELTCIQNNSQNAHDGIYLFAGRLSSQVHHKGRLGDCPRLDFQWTGSMP